MVYIDEHRLANEALARLRAESRRKSEGPFRASSLAEAESMAVLIDENRTPVGILRANALTGKSGAMSQPRRTPER